MADEKKVPVTVDEYIAGFAPERQEILKKARDVIRTAAPDATEKISWAMPTWHQKENLVHFAMGKNHLGFYPGAEAMVHFAPKMTEYKTSKGAVQFPLTKPIPYELIREITAWRVACVS